MLNFKGVTVWHTKPALFLLIVHECFWGQYHLHPFSIPKPRSAEGDFPILFWCKGKCFNGALLTSTSNHISSNSKKYLTTQIPGNVQCIDSRMTGGGFKYFLFSPGEMIQFDEYIFQMGGSTTNYNPKQPPGMCFKPWEIMWRIYQPQLVIGRSSAINSLIFDVVFFPLGGGVEIPLLLYRLGSPGRYGWSKGIHVPGASTGDRSIGFLQYVYIFICNYQ